MNDKDGWLRFILYSVGNFFLMLLDEFTSVPNFQKNGFIFYGTSSDAPVFNGPFAIYPTAYYSGNTDELFAAFENFAQNYVPGGQ